MVVHAPRPKPSRSPTPEAAPAPAVPRHVAVIMDGNGRWAQQRGLSRQAGHRAGTENIRRIIQNFAEREVEYLTLFAFSTENWTRPRTEINALLRLMGRVIDRELGALHANNVRILHIGSLNPVSSQLQRRIRESVELTRNNTGLTVCLAFNYGGRAEIVEAVRRIVEDGMPATQITEDLVAGYLTTRGIPDPDLVIRTAGEMRLSNFLLWQAAYAEYYSTPVYWPDFDEAEVGKALEAYSQRGRRFGGLSDKPSRRPANTADRTS